MHRVRVLLVAARMQHGSLAAVVDWLDDLGVLGSIEQAIAELEAGEP